MKIVLISDCHGKFPKIHFKGDEDIIIHAGDMTSMGTPQELEAFIKWFGSLPVGNRITIAGNHDWGLESRLRPRYEKAKGKTIIEEFSDHQITYLENSSIIVEGIEVYGSPYSPEFNDWAFNAKRGKEISSIWESIPLSADIVITHTPMAYHLDRCAHGDFVGCEDLVRKMSEFNKKVLHVCGHIHEGYGIKQLNSNVMTVNASVLNEHYVIKNLPIVYRFDKTKDSIGFEDFSFLETNEFSIAK